MAWWWHTYPTISITLETDDLGLSVIGRDLFEASKAEDLYDLEGQSGPQLRSENSWICWLQVHIESYCVCACMLHLDSPGQTWSGCNGSSFGRNRCAVCRWCWLLLRLTNMFDVEKSRVFPRKMMKTCRCLLHPGENWRLEHQIWMNLIMMTSLWRENMVTETMVPEIILVEGIKIAPS